ncbi:uncharacterized protein LOC126845776 [Adelges cooleyi]|uniref:uncharacterized protein LOC126845776 n=1 Tax=Adelges cooleyi TaxID=133065 RepID=UPI00217F556D|nr:uncharacterized protein LOC126845776 [Adelges cooleyi]
MASENADKCEGVNSGSRQIFSAQVAALARRIRMMERQLGVHTVRRVQTESAEVDAAQAAAYEMGRRDFRLETRLGGAGLEAMTLGTRYIPDNASRITASISTRTPVTTPSSTPAIDNPTTGGDGAAAGPSTRPRKHKTPSRKRKDNAKKKASVQRKKEEEKQAKAEKASAQQRDSSPKNPQPPLPSKPTKSPSDPPSPFKEQGAE